jgi:hypothetical protein
MAFTGARDIWLAFKIKTKPEEETGFAKRMISGAAQQSLAGRA